MPNTLHSVIMPVIDDAATVGDQLSALAAQTLDETWELIIADGGSTDASLEIVRAWSGRIPGLRIIDATGSLSRGGARNIGAEHARGDLLLFCDADDVVFPCWAAAYARDRANWDLAGGTLDYLPLNPVGAAPAGRIQSHTGELRFLPFMPCANLAMHRRVFETVGGFDEQLVWGKDADFSWRAQLAGYRLGVVPDAIVAKRTRSDSGVLYRESVNWGRATVQLFVRYRDEGMPRPSLCEAARTYAWLTLRARKLGEQPARREWARIAGVRWGRLVESARHRTLCL